MCVGVQVCSGSVAAVKAEARRPATGERAMCAKRRDERREASDARYRSAEREVYKGSVPQHLPMRHMTHMRCRLRLMP